MRSNRYVQVLNEISCDSLLIACGQCPRVPSKSNVLFVFIDVLGLIIESFIVKISRESAEILSITWVDTIGGEVTCVLLADVKVFFGVTNNFWHVRI